MATTATLDWQAAHAAEKPAAFGDYVALLKPRVMSLVVFTGAVGMLMAPGTLHPVLFCVALLCIALGAGAAAAFNMWYDRDIDAIMSRTQNRPIPAGRVVPEDALSLSVFLSLAAVGLMGLAANWVAAAWLLASILFYTGIYTAWLKRRTPQNIVIGGAAGAFPPLIGWAAVTAETPLAAWLLFAIVFFWTPPHFWALSLYRNEDYRRAGIPMLPVVHGIAATKRQILFYSLILVGVSLAPVLLQVAGWFYGVVALGLGVGFLYRANQVMLDQTDASARRLFGYSILYLFLLFGALAIEALVTA
jgi:protoheme IX farnesyltransferase